MRMVLVNINRGSSRRLTFGFADPVHKRMAQHLSPSLCTFIVHKHNGTLHPQIQQGTELLDLDTTEHSWTSAFSQPENIRSKVS